MITPAPTTQKKQSAKIGAADILTTYKYLERSRRLRERSCNTPPPSQGQQSQWEPARCGLGKVNQEYHLLFFLKCKKKLNDMAMISFLPQFQRLKYMQAAEPASLISHWGQKLSHLQTFVRCVSFLQYFQFYTATQLSFSQIFPLSPLPPKNDNRHNFLQSGFPPTHDFILTRNLLASKGNTITTCILSNHVVINPHV